MCEFQLTIQNSPAEVKSTDLQVARFQKHCYKFQLVLDSSDHQSYFYTTITTYFQSGKQCIIYYQLSTTFSCAALFVSQHLLNRTVVMHQIPLFFAFEVLFTPQFQLIFMMKIFLLLFFDFQLSFICSSFLPTCTNIRPYFCKYQQ